ncbi:MAG: NUDIX domain-containing protein [Rhizobium sp.]|nr:NUDIX domain-containing protein [Rhizobium sp.]
MNDISAPPPSSTPLPSATVMLLRERDGLEVLMVERSSASDFASAYVFPGGKVDADDHGEHWLDLVEGADQLSAVERALRIAALREVYEETGLLPEACLDGLQALPGSPGFIDIVRTSAGRLPLHHLTPFARWITPSMRPRRFDTWFFLCPLDAGEAACDGHETVSLGWVSPQRALEEEEAGQRLLMFPTKSQLRRLSQCDSIAAAIAQAQNQPIVPIEPAWQVRDGSRYVTIPAGCGYDVCEEKTQVRHE